MSALKCDMCGKESVGKGGTCYVKSLYPRGEDGHWEGWLCLGPQCLKLMKSITYRNCEHSEPKELANK